MKYDLIKLFSRRSGFTLIELMITLSLLSIVIGLAYNFYFYFIRSNDIALKQSTVQQNVRLTKDIIESNIRYASNVTIGNSTSVVPNNYTKIYVNNAGEIMKYDAINGDKKLLGMTSSTTDMTLLFEKSTKDSFIKVTVTGDIDGNNVYFITSEVLLYGGAISGNNSGDMLYFLP
ncbi:prepilin-type N-terminal cleavage/methylation domain-containing protein [Heliobacillus mobilis]|uniref:Prepilin-type N-terminal cleavage/methylation domain-containing protein n=1 Tax=Heliobacterium mobile TaxID=28064 RepID=A0A6I3SKF0_HELMO|nr:prepilin-type N-terminal cleavage/methylation domain-containing protein [Heliobacterium mobile]MTV49379.1 prepilin-type N-terminal cleavage/methylation domain-containing protein [Heliobacterium mobile]